MSDGERRQYPVHLPQGLCDRLAVRADTLPMHMRIRIIAFVNSSEGRTAGVSEKLLNGREHPVLSEEKIDGWLAELKLTREEFRRQFAPELAFLQAGSELLLAQPPREELDTGLCRAAEAYLATPSPRSEQEQLACVVKNRGRACPNQLKWFLVILPRSDLRVVSGQRVITLRDVIAERGTAVLDIIETYPPEGKEILAESYALEIQLVKDCLAAVGLEQEAFDSRIRELLREYAAVRVERKRRLA